MNPAVFAHTRTVLYCLLLLGEPLLPGEMMILLIAAVAIAARWLVCIQVQCCERRAHQCGKEKGINAAFSVLSRQYSEQDAGLPQQNQDQN